MSGQRPSIDKIIDIWKADCGESKVSSHGVVYVVIPLATQYNHFLDLIKTLLDNGFTIAEIESVGLRTKIATKCWPDIIQKMSVKEIKRARTITAMRWDEAVNKFSDFKISRFVEEKKPESIIPAPHHRKTEVKEPSLEEMVNPKNRLVSTQKIDRSNDTNWELLEELGIEEVSDE